MGPLMINMAFMPLYMWEMWDVTPVTHERTDKQWKVEQYSVWAESAIRILLLIVQVATVATIYILNIEDSFGVMLYCFESIFAMWVKQNWKRCAQFPANLIFSCSIWSQNDKTVAKMGNIANCICATLVCPLNAFSVCVPICNVFSQSDSLQSFTTWNVWPKRWKSWRNIYVYIYFYI